MRPNREQASLLNSEGIARQDLAGCGRGPADRCRLSEPPVSGLSPPSGITGGIPYHCQFEGCEVRDVSFAAGNSIV